jgi:excisionase family DNA binding protein
MNYPQLLTPEQAAGLLGISPALIRRYCRQGRLGKHIGGRWLISLDDLERFKEKPRRAGNPQFAKVTKPQE